MIDPKFRPVVFAFFMALLMSCIMSLVVSLLNVGLVSNILHIWLRAWGFSFVIAFPTVSVVAPVVGRLTNMFIKKQNVKG